MEIIETYVFYLVIALAIGIYVFLAISWWHNLTLVYQGHDEELKQSMFAKIENIGLLKHNIVFLYLKRNKNGKIFIDFDIKRVPIWQIVRDFKFIRDEDYQRILEKYEELKRENARRSKAKRDDGDN